MKIPTYTVHGKVWLYPGNAAWHFMTIQKGDAEKIKKEYIWPRRGFGSIPVNVTLGSMKWKTSIFPDKGGTFLLPLKKEVRQKEGIAVGDTVNVVIEVLN